MLEMLKRWCGMLSKSPEVDEAIIPEKLIKDIKVKDNFEKCLEVILEHEGGYVDHPKDPGGATNYGVTIGVAKKLKLDIDGDGDVDKNDVKLFTPEIVEPVYRKKYWDKINGDELPNGIDLCVFDWGVNSGPGRAAKYLQKIVGALPDGDIGSETIKAVKNACANVGTDRIIKQYCKDRQEYYESLKTFKHFGRGWTRRNKETEEKALKMVKS